MLILWALLASISFAQDPQTPLLFDHPFDGIDAPHCPPKIPLSCQNKTIVENSCCYDDSLFLSTQFWNYYPAIGPNDTFTLHGLWPDNCDGSYEQFCDNSMNIDNVTEILTEFKEFKLLNKMKEIWLNINHNDESLWLHEFNKHGTCIDTIKKSCYEGFEKFKNVVDFFKVSVNLFEVLPTFDWLNEAGIVPSTEITYNRIDIENVFLKKFGALPFIKCNKYNGIQEIWYFHSKKGSLLEQNFIPIDSLIKSGCPETGIKFYPKGSLGKEPPNKGGPTRGYIKLENQEGCLIRTGKWIIGGGCATYFLEEAPFGGYNLKTRNGYCAISDDNSFNCGRKIKPMQFQLNKSSGILSLNGKNDWSTDNTPKKFHYVPIYLNNDKKIHFKLKFQKI